MTIFIIRQPKVFVIIEEYPCGVGINMLSGTQSTAILEIVETVASRVTFQLLRISSAPSALAHPVSRRPHYI